MSDVIDIPLSRLKYFKPLLATAMPNAQVEAMAADIRTNGVLEPLIVRPVGDLFEVVCGLLRWKGALVADLKSVPAEVRQLSDEEALELSATDNMETLSYLEIVDHTDVLEDVPGVFDEPRPMIGPYKIDEPLGRGLCLLYAADFSPDDVVLLVGDDKVTVATVERDLALFYAGLAKGRLHVEGSGYDVGQIMLCYIEAYLDLEEPNVAFGGPGGPNYGLWEGLSMAEREEVVSDTIRLSPIVNAAMLSVFNAP